MNDDNTPRALTCDTFVYQSEGICEWERLYDWQESVIATSLDKVLGATDGHEKEMNHTVDVIQQIVSIFRKLLHRMLFLDRHRREGRCDFFAFCCQHLA